MGRRDCAPTTIPTISAPMFLIPTATISRRSAMTRNEMLQDNSLLTGGCQCGAVRFRVERLGGAAICHCRMCQKAFGGFFGPLVSGYGVVWTRNEPDYFQSS